MTKFYRDKGYKMLRISILSLCFLSLFSCRDINKVTVTPEISGTRKLDHLMRENENEIQLSRPFQRDLRIYLSTIKNKKSGIDLKFSQKRILEDTYGVRYQITYASHRKIKMHTGSTTDIDKVRRLLFSVPSPLLEEGYKIAKIRISAHNSAEYKWRGKYVKADINGRMVKKENGDPRSVEMSPLFNPNTVKSDLKTMFFNAREHYVSRPVFELIFCNATPWFYAIKEAFYSDYTDTQARSPISFARKVSIQMDPVNIESDWYDISPENILPLLREIKRDNRALFFAIKGKIKNIIFDSQWNVQESFFKNYLGFLNSQERTEYRFYIKRDLQEIINILI